MVAGAGHLFGGSIAGVPVGDLPDPNAAVAAPVRCDAVAWSLFGIGMAGWNTLLPLGLPVAWLTAARARGQASLPRRLCYVNVP